MATADTPEQAMRLHLEKIQHTIANQLCIGALFPERRRQCAEKVVDLKNEADHIAQNPEEFRILEAWEIDDPDHRTTQVELTVNSVFKMAPEDHLLSECLIDYWTDTLQETADTRNRSAWEKQCSDMRRDADIMRRSKPVQIDVETEHQNRSPDHLIYGIQKRLAKIAENRSKSRKKSSSQPWRKACTHAMQLINQRAIWLLQESNQGIDWTRPDSRDSQSLKAIKFRLSEEFQSLYTQTDQLEQAEDLSN